MLPCKPFVSEDVAMSDTGLQPLSLRISGAKPGKTHVFDVRLTPSLR